MSSHPGIWAVVSFAKHLREQREILNNSGGSTTIDKKLPQKSKRVTQKENGPAQKKAFQQKTKGTDLKENSPIQWKTN
jgi:hypothetical protein